MENKFLSLVKHDHTIFERRMYVCLEVGSKGREGMQKVSPKHD